MKKIVFLTLLFSTLFMSCNIDSNTPSFYLEIMPITSVDIPSEFTHGETYEIEVSYYTSTSCHVFNDFIYEIDDNERTIAVVNTVYQNTDCLNETELKTATFTFLVSNLETYIFKFYQGDGSNGEDQYYIVEVPVVE